MAQLARIKKELEMLATDPGPGVSAWPIDDDMTNLGAQIQGPQDSAYAEGTYSLSVQLPDRYPFEPPRVRFLTPIYHPNIDSDGRICLDTLKMQPQGSWSPSVNINTVLLTIRMLMQTPNADDGLVPEITEEFKRSPALWLAKATEHTRRHAVARAGAGAGVSVGLGLNNEAGADVKVGAGARAGAEAGAGTGQPAKADTPAVAPAVPTGPAAAPLEAAPAAPPATLKRPLDAPQAEEEEEDEEEDDDEGFYVTDSSLNKRSRGQG